LEYLGYFRLRVKVDLKNQQKQTVWKFAGKKLHFQVSNVCNLEYERTCLATICFLKVMFNFI